MRHIIISLTATLALSFQLSAQVKLKVLHNFGSSDDGNVPSGSLFLDGQGNLYGVTGGGPGEYGMALPLSSRRRKTEAGTRR